MTLAMRVMASGERGDEHVTFFLLAGIALMILLHVTGLGMGG